MEKYICIMSPRGALTSIPSARQIFGSICWIYRWFYGEKALIDCLERFTEDSPLFLLTDCMPCKVDGDRVEFWLPTPDLPYTFSSDTDVAEEYDKKKEKEKMKSIKRLKSQRFLPLSLICDLQKKGDLKEWFTARINLKSEVEIFKEATFPHIKADRFITSTSGSGELYFQKKIFLGEGWKLYFILGVSEKFKKEICPCLKFLEEHGIGGDTTSGTNVYKIKVEELKKYVDLESALLFRSKIFYSLNAVFPKILPDTVHILYYEMFTLRGIKGYSQLVSRWQKDKYILLQSGAVFETQSQREFFGGLYKVGDVYEYFYIFPLYLNDNIKKGNRNE